VRARTVPILAIFLLAALSAAVAQSEKAAPEREASGEPDHIQVQHILIAYRGSLSGKEISRSREEAKELAHQLFEEAKAGADFDALVKQHTDDSYPGIYGLSNFGVTPAGPEFPRGRMVAAFGDVGFKLAVGEVGMADWNPAKNAQGRPISPFGWHIIKRIE